MPIIFSPPIVLGRGAVLVESRSDFSVLTPLSKIDRVSRMMDPTSLVALPGKWGVLQADNSVANIVPDSDGNKWCVLFGSRTSFNIYEGSDTKSGRITTLESQGYRYQVGVVGYNGTIDIGDMCVVSTNQLSVGKLVSVNYTEETGDYEIVARAEQLLDNGNIIFRTLSPIMITLT